MVKLSRDIAAAVQAANGEPLKVEVPGLDRELLLVDRRVHEAAMEKLAIMEGLADVS